MSIDFGEFFFDLILYFLLLLLWIVLSFFIFRICLTHSWIVSYRFFIFLFSEYFIGNIGLTYIRLYTSIMCILYSVYGYKLLHYTVDSVVWFDREYFLKVNSNCMWFSFIRLESHYTSLLFFMNSIWIHTICEVNWDNWFVDFIYLSITLIFVVNIFIVDLILIVLFVLRTFFYTYITNLNFDLIYMFF